MLSFFWKESTKKKAQGRKHKEESTGKKAQEKSTFLALWKRIFDIRSVVSRFQMEDLIENGLVMDTIVRHLDIGDLTRLAATTKTTRRVVGPTAVSKTKEFVERAIRNKVANIMSQMHCVVDGCTSTPRSARVVKYLPTTVESSGIYFKLTDEPDYRPGQPLDSFVRVWLRQPHGHVSNRTMMHVCEPYFNLPAMSIKVDVWVMWRPHTGRDRYLAQQGDRPILKASCYVYRHVPDSGSADEEYCPLGSSRRVVVCSATFVREITTPEGWKSVSRTAGMRPQTEFDDLFASHFLATVTL